MTLTFLGGGSSSTSTSNNRARQIVRSLVRQSPFAEFSFPMRIVNHDPARRQLIVQNLGPSAVQVGFKNANNQDSNAGTTPVVIPPGKEWVAPNSTYTCFARMVTNGQNTALNIYTETAV